MGIHLIVDIHNIEDFNLLERIEDIIQLGEILVKVGKLNVIGQLTHQFEPMGATLLYLLAESHLSIHTYPEIHYCAIDLYCCNSNLNTNNILEEISKFFNHKCWISKKIMKRE